MARKSTLRLRCPTCKRLVKNTDVEFPFCSKRCRTIDLGRWASGKYVIPSPLPDTGDDAIDENRPDEKRRE